MYSITHMLTATNTCIYILTVYKLVGLTFLSLSVDIYQCFVSFYLVVEHKSSHNQKFQEDMAKPLNEERSVVLEKILSIEKRSK